MPLKLVLVAGVKVGMPLSPVGCGLMPTAAELGVVALVPSTSTAWKIFLSVSIERGHWSTVVVRPC